MTMKPENFDNQSSFNLRKYKLMEIIMAAQDEEYIAAIEEVMNIKEIEAYEAKLKPMTKEEYFEKIDESFEDVKKGDVISMEDYIKEIAEEEAED